MPSARTAWGRRSARRNASWGLSFGRGEFAAPVQAIDVDAERVVAHPCFGAWRLDDDGDHGRPPLGRGERPVHEAALDPAHLKRVAARTHNTCHLDGDRLLTHPRE